MATTKLRSAQIADLQILNAHLAGSIANGKLATNPLARGNHTGTQSADTLTDGATNVAFLATERTKLDGVATAATANDTDANLRARSSHTGAQAISTVTGLQAALDAKIESSLIGATSGVASLDGDGKIPAAQLPNIAITDTFVVSSQAQQVALTAEVGDVAIRSDEAKTYILKTAGAGTFANWELLQTPTAAVASVHGRTGSVVAAASDYTAAQVDNVPSGNLAATTVQAALNELQGDINTLNSSKLAAGNFVIREAPTVSGANDEIYTLTGAAVADTEEVFKNGNLQEPGTGNDYTIATVGGVSVITFLGAAIPVAGVERVRVRYLVAS